jgi:hypothetical protein
MSKTARWALRIISTLILAGLGFFLAVTMAGCAPLRDAPRSVAALDAMSQEDFDAWRQSLDIWVEAIAEEAVKQGADASKITAFATELASTSDASGDPLGSAAAAAGLDSTLMRLLVIEVRSHLRAVGPLPADGRGLDILHGIATAVAVGAAKRSDS